MDHGSDENMPTFAQAWPVPSAVTYIEVADRLHVMAAEAHSPETQQQLELLAQLYERLANASLHYRLDIPPPA